MAAASLSAALRTNVGTNSNLNLLKTITASNFELVAMGTIYTPANIPTGPVPAISSFTANPSTAFRAWLIGENIKS